MLRQQVENDVRNAWTAASTAYQRIPVTEEFLKQANPWALNAIAERLLEASERGLWEEASAEMLEALRGVLLDSEALLEARGETRRSAV